MPDPHRIILTALLTMGLLCQDPAAGGNSAIDLQLPSLGGDTVRLSDYRGHWLALNYWATWCAPCRKEIPELSALNRERDDISVLGLAFEDADAEVFAAFLEDFEVSYPILLVDVYNPPEPFGAPRALPTTYIIDAEGYLAKTFVGPVTREQIEQFVESRP